jgi:pilus assembly protein CpaE
MMSKFKVLIASRCEKTGRTVHALLSKQPKLNAELRIISNGTVDPLHGLTEVPNLLLLFDHNVLGELEALQNMNSTERPELLVFGSGNDAKSIRHAMRAGARDYLTIPLIESELLSAIDEIRKSATAVDSTSDGHLHVFLNGKGGSGATFLATNTAHDLASDGHSVTVVDLDLQFAGLCRYLDLTPKQDIFAALRSIDDLDQVAAEAFTTGHESGLRLLSATGERLRMNEDVIPDTLIRLLDLYCSINDFVVVDLPRQIDGLSAAVIERADQITVVMQQSFPHLHDTARLINILRNELHVESSRINIVVNRYSKDSPILLKDIESAIDVENIIKISNQYRVTSESVNSGVPVSQVDKKSSVTRGLKHLYPERAKPAEIHRGRFSRTLPSLFGR